MEFNFLQNLAPFRRGMNTFHSSLSNGCWRSLHGSFSAFHSRRRCWGSCWRMRWGTILFAGTTECARRCRFFIPAPTHDRNAGSGDPHQGADPFTGGAVRYRDCGADRGIRGRRDCAGGGDEPLEIAARG